MGSDAVKSDAVKDEGRRTKDESKTQIPPPGGFRCIFLEPGESLTFHPPELMQLELRADVALAAAGIDLRANVAHTMVGDEPLVIRNTSDRPGALELRRLPPPAVEPPDSARSRKKK